MVYMNLEENEFTPTKIKEKNKEAISAGCETGILCEDNEDKVEIDEITEEGVISAHCESKFGYVSFDILLDSEDMVTLITSIVKKMNKFKSLIESLK